MEIDFDSPKHQPKQYRTTTRRLVTLAAVAALTVGGAAACASTAASAKPSSTVGGTNAAPSASGSPSIQPGGPMIPVPSASSPGSSPGSPTAPVSVPGQQALKGNGYTSNGDELTVYFFAGICEKYGLQANQSTPGQVQVTVVVTQHQKAGMPCPMLVRQQQVSTDLGSPLDGRSVVDASTGRALPQLDAPSGTKYYSPSPAKIGS